MTATEEESPQVPPYLQTFYVSIIPHIIVPNNDIFYFI